MFIQVIENVQLTIKLIFYFLSFPSATYISSKLYASYLILLFLHDIKLYNSCITTLRYIQDIQYLIITQV